MDRARRDLVVQMPRHYGEGRGTFSLRSPVRPNPIALSVVKLVKVEGTTLLGAGHRLPRQHAAARHQALFRLGRFQAGREVGWHRDRMLPSVIPAKAGTQIRRTGFPLSRE